MSSVIVCEEEEKEEKKVVNIMDDEDFPEMEEGADPFAAFAQP